jgi:hypothetical protein
MILTHETNCETTGRVIGQVFRATVSPAVRIMTSGTVP